MRNLYDILIEAKDDNLHEFIQYLKDCGDGGELKSPKRNFKKMLLSATAKEIASVHWRTIVDRFSEFYCEENGIDEFDEDEYHDDFELWVKQVSVDTITTFSEINNNNCLYIERAITIPKFSDKDRLLSDFRNRYDGHLGVCWSYCKGAANAYEGNFGEDEIILKGYVRPDDVDLDNTVLMNIIEDEEYELTINYDAPIQLTEITTSKGNHKIFTGNLILKA